MAQIGKNCFADYQIELCTVPTHFNRPRAFYFTEGPERSQIDNPHPPPLQLSAEAEHLRDEAERAFGLSPDQEQEQYQLTPCPTIPSGIPVLGRTERAHEHAESAPTRRVLSVNTVSTSAVNASERRQQTLDLSSTARYSPTVVADGEEHAIAANFDGDNFESDVAVPANAVAVRGRGRRVISFLAAIQRPLHSVVDRTMHGVQVVTRRFRYPTRGA